MQNYTKNRQAGFTIVELLIVIVVIAILATISIVAYRGIQDRARASEANAALTQAKKKLELYKVDNAAYPTTGNLASADVKDTDVSYQYTSDGTSYCLTGTVGTTSYKTSNTDTPQPGGCAGHGQGGVAAITNLIVNPSVEGGTYSPNIGYGGSTITIDSTKSVSGTKSAKLTSNSTTNFNGMMWAAPNTPSGAVYNCSISIMGTPGKNVYVSGRFHDTSGGYIGESFGGSKVVTLSASWQSVTTTFTSPANSGTMFIQVRLVVAEVGVDLWGDGGMCTKGSNVYNYADGSSPNWIWNGTANASISTGPPL